MSERWYKIVTFGSGYAGPVGPYDSEEAAAVAYERWFRAGGWEQNPARHMPRIAGPYATRDEANAASIADAPVARDL